MSDGSPGQPIETSTRPRAVVWCTPDQAPLVGDVAQAAGLDLLAAGSHEKGRGGEVAKTLGVEHATAVRAALTTTACDLVWLASPGSFGADAAEPALAALLTARTRGVRIATLEPMPATAFELAGTSWTGRTPAPADAVRFVPLTRRAASFREAWELIGDTFGRTHTMSVECLGRPEHGSLGARLFAAMDLVLSVMGEPELIDAGYTGPAAGAGLHALPGETLRGLSGHLTANLRFADGRAAVLLCSDRAGVWETSATLLSPAGRLRIHDSGFVWTGPDGALTDAHQADAKNKSDDTDPGTRAIAESLRRLCDPAMPPESSPDHGVVLAMSQAALLSARTGQPESPATIQRLVAGA